VIGITAFEMGYRKVGGGWISLGFSAIGPGFPPWHPSEQILDQFRSLLAGNLPTSSSTTPLLRPLSKTAYKRSA